MIALRPWDETVEVAIAASTSTIFVAASTHAWIAAPLFGVFFILRFALQPPATAPLTSRRRALLSFVGCSALACLVWAVGVRLAHWPG
ncbi:MAG TPA: hypothetical protein VGM67_04970 [Gemmatimonadaceae bacterium]